MSFKDNYFPFLSGSQNLYKKAEEVSEVFDPEITKLFRIKSAALGLGGITFFNRSSFEPSPYNFDQIIKAAETDSFIRQGFSKYKELILKEGWDIVGENDEAVDYIYERFDYMEISMRRTIEELLLEIVDQLIKFGNAFVAKAHGDLGPVFPGKLKTEDGALPVVGYYVVPAETIEIRRSKTNKPLRYRQRMDSDTLGSPNKTRSPSWLPDDMIHFTLDKKPGHAFGTPFMVSVIDDIIALRQIEEDIQNLIHKELFPLYKYKVGTEEHPAEPEEIDRAAEELAYLRTDGGLVLPDRHDVDVIGSQNNALDASGYLRHFVTRVCTGLGLSPHHLGIMEESGNRAVTDRLDIALYDKVKMIQKYLADTIRLTILSELLMEGGFDPIAHPARKGESDRCDFRFREIDVDTQVKRENHIIDKFTKNTTTLEETRLSLNLDPEVDVSRLFMSLSAEIQAAFAPEPASSEGGASNKPNKPDAQKPSTGGRRNTPNRTKGSGNQNRPANQHGRRMSPGIRHSDLQDVYKVVELLEEDSEDNIQSIQE